MSWNEDTERGDSAPQRGRRPAEVIELPTAQASHSLEAERVILGSVMLCPEVLGEPELQVLAAEDFYSERHQVLYALLLGMHQRSEAIELLSVVERITAEGRAEDVGGLGYVASLPDGVAAVESAGYYARLVRQRSTLRILRGKALELVEMTGRGDVDLHDLQRRADQVAHSIEGRASGQAWQPVSEVIDEVYTLIEERAAVGGEDPGLPCGALSRILRPKHGQMVVLAARPAMGKTGLALEWAEHMAEQGLGVGYVSAEMPMGDLQVRRLAKRAGLSAWMVEQGKVNALDLAMLRSASDDLSRLPLWLTDAPGLTVDAVRSRVYELQRLAERAGSPLEAVFIDHIGKLRGQPGQSGYDAQSYVSGELAALALRTGLCIIALAQLNRGVEKRTPPRPVMSDLRESGKIEEDARCVMLLYRPGYYDESGPDQGRGEVIVAKQNGGPTGSLWLPWQPEWGSYDLTVEAERRSAW